MDQTDSVTRQKILRAALERFAHGGYAGTSVQDIVGAARVTKPVLYYYFTNKAALFQALVDSAHDERHRLMQEAAQRGRTLEEKLVEIIASLFEFFNGHRELMRLALATAFAAPGEVPAEIRYVEKCERNFEFIHSLIKKERGAAGLDRRFGSKELAFGVYGLMNVYIMSHLVLPEGRLNRPTAERIVKLFLSGAAAKK